MKTLLATESSHQMICHVGRVRPIARQRSEMFWYGNQRLMMGTNQDPACQPAERRVWPATCLAARYCQMTQSTPVARSARDDRMETTDVLWSYTSSKPRAPLSPLRKPVAALIPNVSIPIVATDMTPQTIRSTWVAIASLAMALVDAGCCRGSTAGSCAVPCGRCSAEASGTWPGRCTAGGAGGESDKCSSRQPRTETQAHQVPPADPHTDAPFSTAVP